MSKKTKKYKQQKLKQQLLLVLMIIIVMVSGSAIYTVIYNRKHTDNNEIKAKAETKAVENKVTTANNDPKVEANDDTVIDGKNYSKAGEPFVDDVEMVRKMINQKKTIDSKKIIYLTFDDGPSSNNTPKILDILKQQNVKATFMILGNELNKLKDPEIIKRMIKEGHALGNHTYTHVYSKLYPHGSVNVNTFMSEVEQTNNKIREILGDGFNTRVIRMPGGHMSWKGTAALDKALNEKGYCYIDWNALNGDAVSAKKSKDELIKNFKHTAANKNIIVSLMHDANAKKSTVQALPEIIKFLKDSGYEFRTLA